MQFRDTSGENVRLTGLIKDLENRIAGFKPRMEVKEPIVNPANDPITTRSVYNAPISNTNTISENIVKEIKPQPIPRNPRVEVPAGFNEPITYNDNLGEEVQREVNREENIAPITEPRFEFVLVPEAPTQSRRGRPKGSKNKPREPRQPSEFTSNIPNRFLQPLAEGDITPSEFEDFRTSRASSEPPVSFTTSRPKMQPNLPAGFQFGIQNEPRVKIAESGVEFV
jgi:hypothetical protein